MLSVAFEIPLHGMIKFVRCNGPGHSNVVVEEKVQIELRVAKRVPPAVAAGEDVTLQAELRALRSKQSNAFPDRFLKRPEDPRRFPQRVPVEY